MWLQIQYPRIYRRKIPSVLWYRNDVLQCCAVIQSFPSALQKGGGDTVTSNRGTEGPPPQNKKDTEMFGGV